jgi:glycine/D-amino acid oxidase-like deaminating enzyme
MTVRARDTIPRSPEPSSYWLAKERLEPAPPLCGRREADVAIVGAGFTGLWTSLHLKRLDSRREVVVLDQETVGYGATGRNAGMLSECIDHSHELAVAHFGREEATRLAVLGRDNVAEMLAFVASRGIECDLERTGRLQVALSPSRVPGLRAALECARSLGLGGHRLLDAEEARAEIHCDRYHGALFDPGGGLLDPVRLARGLRREAEKAGTVLCEHTRVTAFERKGGGVRLCTPDGEVLARRVVLATNAYTHYLLPRLRFRFLPLYDYVLASEPLTRDQRAILGWRHRQGVTDSRAFFKYYRLTADDRVVWGTSEAVYHPGSRVEARFDHSETHYRALRESFVRHFPALASLRFPYAWGGPIDATTRFTPFFGTAASGRILYGLGFTGHGLGTTHLAGKVLAHMALDEPSDLLSIDLVRRKPLPYPPEPLRSWGVAAVTRALRRVDAGGRRGLLLHLLDVLGIGLSS